MGGEEREEGSGAHAPGGGLARGRARGTSRRSAAVLRPRLFPSPLASPPLAPTQTQRVVPFVACAPIPDRHARRTHMADSEFQHLREASSPEGRAAVAKDLASHFTEGEVQMIGAHRRARARGFPWVATRPGRLGVGGRGEGRGGGGGAPLARIAGRARSQPSLTACGSLPLPPPPDEENLVLHTSGPYDAKADEQPVHSPMERELEGMSRRHRDFVREVSGTEVEFASEEQDAS